MAQHFDSQKLELDGDPFPVMENVMFSASQDYSNFSVSRNGTLVFWKGSNLGRQLGWFDRSGKQLATVGPPAEYNDIVLSPDGKRAATQRLDGSNSDIWIIDLDRELPIRFTFAQSSEDNPAWSADGNYVYYTSTDAGQSNICRKSSGGAGGEEVIARDFPAIDDGIDVSPDGKDLIFLQVGEKSNEDIWDLPLSGGSKIFPVLNSEFAEFTPRFSPDGHWLAYVSAESGRPEVYVRNFPSTGSQWQVSAGGGGQPHWRRDGKELFFVAPDRKIMAVDVKLGTNFTMGTPHALFQSQVSSYAAPNRYDVSADGQKFLVNSLAQESSSTPITVIVNWAASLKR
jgi:Tol biopolymer transport system component